MPVTQNNQYNTVRQRRIHSYMHVKQPGRCQHRCQQVSAKFLAGVRSCHQTCQQVSAKILAGVKLKYGPKLDLSTLPAAQGWAKTEQAITFRFFNVQQRISQYKAEAGYECVLRTPLRPPMRGKHGGVEGTSGGQSEGLREGQEALHTCTSWCAYAAMFGNSSRMVERNFHTYHCHMHSTLGYHHLVPIWPFLSPQRLAHTPLFTRPSGYPAGPAHGWHFVSWPAGLILNKVW